MDGTAENPNVDLGWRSQAILAAIHEHGGTANTREIRDTTGIQGGTKVPYRMKNKLPSAGLIEIERPGLDERGRNLPMEATLTEAGERLAQRIVEAEDEDRLANMTDYAEQLEATVNQLETRIDELEAAESSTGERGALVETVDDLTASKYGAWNDGATQQFEELLLGMLALRGYLLEESSLSRDELDERKAEAQAALENEN
jgi:DNA-binding MarR family transcriptional regulator